MLGLIIDTNRLTVGIPYQYLKDVLNIINTTWHQNRKSFTVQEAQQLTGKLGHIREGAHWVFHLLTHLFASIAYALAENKKNLFELSREFKDIIQSI
jgi:hypothetical protein